MTVNRLGPRLAMISRLTARQTTFLVRWRPLRLLLVGWCLLALGCAQPAPPPAAVGSAKAKAMRQRRLARSATPELAKAEPVVAEGVSAAADIKPGSAQSPLLAILDDARAEEVTSHLAIPNKVNRYAQKLVAHYDQDGDGVLASAEWQAMRGNAAQADFNHDGSITPAELAQRIAIYSLRRSLRLRAMPLRPPGESATPAVQVADSGGARPAVGAESAVDDALPARTYYTPKSRLPSGVDDWFLETDADGDGQITMREFTAHLSEGDVTRFASLDPDGDGVVTAAEYVDAKSKEPQPEAPAEPAPMDAGGMPPQPAPMMLR